MVRHVEKSVCVCFFCATRPNSAKANSLLAVSAKLKAEEEANKASSDEAA